MPPNAHIVELRPGLSEFLETAEGRTVSREELAAMLKSELGMRREDPAECPDSRWLRSLASARSPGDVAAEASSSRLAALGREFVDATVGLLEAKALQSSMRSDEMREATRAAARSALADARRALRALEAELKREGQARSALVARRK
jgi:hypothetical protein